LLRYLWLS